MLLSLIDFVWKSLAAMVLVFIPVAIIAKKTVNEIKKDNRKTMESIIESNKIITRAVSKSFPKPQNKETIAR